MHPASLRRKPTIPFAFLLLLTLLLAGGWAGPATAAKKKNVGSKARIVKVVDGDTVTVRVHGQIRTVDLLGLQAPKLAQKAVKKRRGVKARKAIPAECGATQSRTALRRIALDRRKKGRVVWVAVSSRRRVKKARTKKQRAAVLRATAKVGRIDSAGEQLRKGWGKRRKVTAKGFSQRKKYTKELAKAKRLKRGIFSPLCVKPPPKPLTPAPAPAPGPLPPGPGARPAALPPCPNRQTLRNPIDPRQQTAIGWGQRSNWLQPWRAYMDTRPAADLANGTGVIFDAPPGEVTQASRLLAESGFRRARYIVDWSAVYRTSGGSLAFRQPSKFAPVIQAFRANGLRPMILLNAQPDGAGFTRTFNLQLAAPASAGSRTLELTSSSASQVTAARAAGDHVGLRAYRLNPGILITAVDADGTARLSRPLEKDLAAGDHNGTAAEAAPFEHPTKAGAPNPAYEETLDAWLEYVRFVTTETKRVLGTADYDVEVWNELSFDSEFLDANVYNEPDVDTGTGDTNRAILEATAAFINDPANGVEQVRVGDGFAANDPLPSGATAPAGVDAVNKHPYAPLWDIYPGVAQRFPQSKLGTDYPALDALGQVDDQTGFVPSFRSHFPEHYLTGMQTDHLIRDLSPITTSIDGVPHGRSTRSVDGTQPRIWISEHTLLPVTPSAEANRHVQTKIALRSLLAYVGAGAELVALYSVNDQQFGLVEPGFFAEAKASRTYPGTDAGGRTMDAFRRIAATMGSAPGPAEVSPLSLLSISDCHSNAIFKGDGTAAHPSLYDRDALAFFPFQTSARRYVVPFWVMTRDVAKVYHPGLPASDLSRYDFPPESFTLEVGGVKGDAPRVSALDPVTGQSTPATVLDRRGDVLEVEVEATDSPRLLTIEG